MNFIIIPQTYKTKIFVYKNMDNSITAQMPLSVNDRSIQNDFLELSESI